MITPKPDACFCKTCKFWVRGGEVVFEVVRNNRNTYKLIEDKTQNTGTCISGMVRSVDMDHYLERSPTEYKNAIYAHTPSKDGCYLVIGENFGCIYHEEKQ